MKENKGPKLELELKKLVSEIAIPRFIGSRGNELTKNKILKHCRSYASKVFVDEFLFHPKAEKISVTIIGLLLLIEYLALMLSHFYLQPISLFFATALPLTALVYFHFWIELFDMIGKTGKTRCASILAELGNPNSKNKYLITAHRDSLSTRPKGTTYFHGFVWLFYKMPVIMGIVYLLLNLVNVGILVVPAILGAAIALSIFVLVASFGNNSAGAYDNGSGVAILMLLLKTFSKKKLDAHVIFGFLDAEEAGYGGSISLAKKMRRNYKVVNIDGIGAGEMEILIADGPLRSKTSQILNGKIIKLAKKEGEDLSPYWSQVYPGGDHVPFVRKGFEATTITSSSYDIHSETDTVSRIKFAQCAFVYRLLHKLVTVGNKNVV